MRENHPNDHILKPLDSRPPLVSSSHMQQFVLQVRLFHPVEHSFRKLDKSTLVLTLSISESCSQLTTISQQINRIPGEGFNCLASMLLCKVSRLLKAPRFTD